MSIRLMTRVWDLDLNSELQHVLLFLADKADDDGLHCYPSVDYIAWALNKSERAIQYALSTLRDMGLIVPLEPIKGGRGVRTHYQIVLDAGTPKAPFVPPWKKGANPAPIGNGATDATERVQPVQQKGATGGTGFNNEPSVEPLVEPSESAPPPEAVVWEYFRLRIQPRARKRPSALTKIKARLKSYTVDELTKAIDTFAAHPWWMEHNGNQGAEWFFSDDAKIERWLNLTLPKIVNGGESPSGGGSNGTASATRGSDAPVRKPTGLEKYG